MTDDTNHAMHHVPTRLERFTRRLGFRYHMRDFDDDRPEFKGWAMTVLRFQFSWADRFRILFGGRLRVDVRLRSKERVTDMEAIESFRIYSPWEKEW